MANNMLSEVKINGTEISIDGTKRLRKWIVPETFGQSVGECIIECTKTIFSDIPALDSGMSITIKRGLTTKTDQFVFEGIIDRIDKSGAIIIIYGKDLMNNLIKATVTYSYDGDNFPTTEAKGSDIAKNLIEVYGGMTATVIDTGTTLTLKKFICNGTDIFERLQSLANIYDYQIYYNADDSTIHFEPKGYNSTGTILYVGGSNSNVNNIPKWSFDNTQCINKLTVKGAAQEVQDEEFFNGDNTPNQIFTLSKKPNIVQVFDGSTLKTPGVTDSTSGTFDYTIDKENKEIKCTTNWTPAIGSNNIKINYTNSIPVPVQVEDVASQGKYGIYAKEMFFSDIQTVSDAETKGQGIITKYSEPFALVMVKPASITDLDRGTQIRVIDSINDEDRTLVINKVIKKYPHNGDELYLGDKEWKLADWGMFTLERIRRLEEEVQKNVDQLLILIRTADIDIPINSRYMKAEIKGYGGTGFLLDSPTLGMLDSNILDTLTSATSTNRIIWRDNTYIESFYDTDFKGDSSGSPTWSTVNKNLIL